MTYRFIILLFIFIGLTSFLRNEEKTISKVQIYFYPSFNAHSFLQLDKKADLGTFSVKSIKQKITFKISESNKELFSNFFDEKYIRSMEVKERTGVADGMHVFVRYKQQGENITIDLGNDRTQLIDSILLQQILFLNNICTDSEIKNYIKDLVTYIN